MSNEERFLFHAEEEDES